MITRETIFQSRDTDKIWKKYCGFVDLNIDEFMAIQRQLLEEQLEVVGESPIWKKLFNGKKPKTLEEFREVVPLTTYWSHYADYIGEENKTEHLDTKPLLWAHSSGRGGGYKWIPWTEQGLEKYADCVMASMIMACADRKGDVKVEDGFRLLSILAPSPYISGISGYALSERFNLKFIPPPEIADSLDFQERIKLGFKMAMETRIDFVGAVSTALVKVGESMTERSQGIKFSKTMLKPAVMIKLLRAYMSSKRARRQMLPKDIWPVKGMACGGTDSSIYKEKLKYYWGREPHEGYGLTEAGVLATQSWTKKDMTFYPYLAFLEFIPEEDWLKSRADPGFKPRTLLINEVEPGKIYEVVLTNFHGMYLARYRPGDLIRVTALEDSETGIKIPQMTFYSRADFLIDLYSIVRLDERSLWQAIDNIGVKYEDWTARKEFRNDEPILKIYFEPKAPTTNATDLEKSIHEQLRLTCPLYEEAYQEMQTNPVNITLLKPGSFQKYYTKRQSEGADIAHLKPPHMNSTDKVIENLLNS